MSTLSDAIDAQINALHRKIASLVGQRKYDDIDVIREEIRVLEDKKLTINKVSELKILMGFMTGDTAPATDWDRACVYAWADHNPLAMTNEARADRRVLLAIYEAVVELDRKVSCQPRRSE
jgi:hypothetical protein